MMPLAELQTLVEKSFPGDQIHLTSPMGDDNHFQLVVVSARFREKNRVEQHQMIYSALGDAMAEAVHALAIKTFTPEQWDQARQTP